MKNISTYKTCMIQKNTNNNQTNSHGINQRRKTNKKKQMKQKARKQNLYDYETPVAGNGKTILQQFKCSDWLS